MNSSFEQIIKMYLMENGYDGLYNSEGECACELSDLFPCDCPHGDHCKAGYKCEQENEDDLFICSTKKEN